MSFLYLSAVFESQECLKHVAISPAANKWQTHLLAALNDHVPVINLTGHMPEPLWPKGDAFPKGLLINSSESLDYLNIPFLRSASLALTYKKGIESFINKAAVKFDGFITYNPPSWLQRIIKEKRDYLQVPWVTIVADGNAPQGADGYVFLSSGYFEKFDVAKEKKIHIDGAVYPQELPEAECDSHLKTVVYSGTTSKWGGLANLLEAFQGLSDVKDINLVVTGNGSLNHIPSGLKNNDRIQFKGMVSEAELSEIFRCADVFVNPRPNLYDNANNFPSKLFDYLAYEKPIVSSKTLGISEKYNEVLIYSERSDSSSLAASIRKALALTEAELDAYKTRLKNFNAANTWNAQASRLSSFLKSL